MLTSNLGMILQYGPILLFVWLAGCSQMTQTEIKMLETRELDLPYDEAYTAASNGLFALGYTIDHSDKASGILTGKKHDPNVGGKLAGAVLLGVVGVLAAGENDEAVTFMLTRVKPNVTQLRMKVLYNGKPSTDRNLMTRIWQQIEREAMLDARPPGRPPATQPAAGVAEAKSQ